MKLIDLTVKEFIAQVDSSSPAPGGGSVAALSSTLGIALTRMVGHLTVGKKKFKALSSEIQLEFADVMSALEIIKDQMVLLIDQDTEAFNEIMKAFQMPKETDHDIDMRNQAIEQATEKAIMVPLKVASLSVAALHHLPFMIKYGNKTAISDLGVSTLNLSSGIDGACMNVLINLPGLKDHIAASQFRKQVDQLILEAHQIRDEVLELVYNSLKEN